MPEEDLVAFVATSISSVWALELLLLLRRDPAKYWEAESLIRELRSSPVVIDEGLKRLQGAGLVMQDDRGTYRYQAASPRLDQLVSELQAAYATRPMTVIEAIVAAPSDKLRAFSDAFKLKD
ncbi:MAG: hypothetical protein ACRECO_20895 [Xanthobacteraceae bacterium]